MTERTGLSHNQPPKLDLREQNFIDDLSELPKNQQGFFGAHLARGEDGHIPKKPDGTPITLDEMHAYQQGGKDPFRPEY